MSSLKLTVIVPVKNNPVGIALLLESLKKQSLSKEEFEVIVIDNGSTDHTREIIKHFPVKLCIEKKLGSYASRNLGIKKAKGNYLAFIDSDCIASPKWLEMGVNAISNKKVSLVAGRIQFLFKELEPNVYEYLDSVTKLNQKSYVKTGFGATANLFVKREVFTKHGLFKETLQSGGDYEFGQRVTSKEETIVYSASAMVYHPARYCASQIIKKTIRVAQGYKKLEHLTSLNHHNLNLFSWLPIISLKKNNYYSKFNFFKKIKLLLFANLQKYLSLIIRAL